MMTTLTLDLDRVLNQLRGWQIFATRTKARAQAGELNSDRARQIVTQARTTLENLARIPRTPAIADKAAEEWSYQGTIGTDFSAIETAIAACGNWVATRDSALWTGYGIENNYPWLETVPTFTAAQVADLITALDNSDTAIAAFLGNIGRT